MNKRAFLKRCASFAPVPFVQQLPLLAQTGRLQNWAGNLTYSTNTISYPKTVAEAAAAIAQHEKLKILGTRHCFNTIADSRHRFISLQEIKTMELNETAKTVRVGAGIRYGDLAPFLDGKGFALHNLASLPHISVAGAVGTATHGSGMAQGNLSTAVTALEFITASGEIVRLQKSDGDAFKTAVVHLGAIGAVSHAELEVQPRFDMRQFVFEHLPLAALTQHFREIMSAGYSVSLFTDWQQESINEVWVKERCDGAGTVGKETTFFGAKAATRNMHPIAALPAENCTAQMGVCGTWYERMPHFKMGFTPSSGKELQSEYFVPLEQAVPAILAIQRLGRQTGPHLFISEIRSIAADDLWMSPCYQRPSITIHFTWKQEWEAVRKLLPLIEKTLAPFHPRPHWGKLFTLPKETLAAEYPQLPAFRELVNRYDPRGKFRNDFLQQHLF
ncbi:MAG: D-arabinono-1,4-lactone oxidase [Flavihumibacter sp.]